MRPVVIFLKGGEVVYDSDDNPSVFLAVGRCRQHRYSPKDLSTRTISSQEAGTLRRDPQGYPYAVGVHNQDAESIIRATSQRMQR